MLFPCTSHVYRLKRLVAARAVGAKGLSVQEPLWCKAGGAEGSSSQLIKICGEVAMDVLRLVFEFESGP